MTLDAGSLSKAGGSTTDTGVGDSMITGEDAGSGVGGEGDEVVRLLGCSVVEGSPSEAESGELGVPSSSKTGPDGMAGSATGAGDSGTGAGAGTSSMTGSGSETGTGSRLISGKDDSGMDTGVGVSRITGDGAGSGGGAGGGKVVRLLGCSVVAGSPSEAASVELGVPSSSKTGPDGMAGSETGAVDSGTGADVAPDSGAIFGVETTPPARETTAS